MLSCSDFTEVTPKGIVLIETTEEYKGLIIDPVNSSVVGSLGSISCDDFFSVDQQLNDIYGRAYYWAEKIYVGSDSDEGWNDTYSRIYITNLIIQNIMDSKDGSTEEKEAIRAEAQLWRAYYYWWLQNQYSPAYDEATAETELSVPMITVPDLEALHSRATVKTVTDSIWSFLDNIEELLPEKASNDYRPTKAAYHAFKARIYFYMYQYDQAAQEADLALAYNNNLNDMRTWKFTNPNNPHDGIENKPYLERKSPESIWHQSCNFSSIIGLDMYVCDDLKVLYSDKDLRFKFWFTDIDPNGEMYPLEGEYRTLHELDYNISVPEMMLIKAEALARKNDDKALDILNDLRTYRFLEEDYVKLTRADGSDLLSIVLDERRRELFYTGLRWFDMKRLGKEGIYTKTITREYDGVVYKLEPNSKLYVFPFSDQVLKLNKNIIPNDRKL